MGRSMPPVVAEFDAQHCEEVGVEGVPVQVGEAPVVVDPDIECSFGTSEDETMKDQN